MDEGDDPNTARKRTGKELKTSWSRTSMSMRGREKHENGQRENPGRMRRGNRKSISQTGG